MNSPSLRIVASSLVLALAAQVAAAAPPAGGRRPSAAAARRIAFLGLRPAADAALGQTAIAQLPDAQRLRTVAENVVEVLTGANVLRHDDLRASLGRTYLADLFDCRGEAACQLRLAAPLARQGIGTAVVADYFADGSQLRIRVRRLDLAGMRVVDEATVTMDRAAAETLAAWQKGLRPLFQDVGKLRIVANVAGATCTIDGRPCPPPADGAIDVEEGEHVLELSKDGYRRASRVVTARRGEEQRIAVALEELPVQVQKPPDPSSRLPTFAPPTEEAQVAPFGSIRMAILYDDINMGDREDVVASPPGTRRERSLVFFPRPAVIGVRMQAPRKASGWELRGGFGLALVRGDLPEFDSAFAEIVKPEAGFRVMLGWGASIVSGLTAGTLTLPEGFGDLAPGLIGVTVSQSVGPLVFEGFLGKQKTMFNAAPEPLGATPFAFSAGRIAYVDDRTKGRLYGDDYPLTVSISGIYGKERVGLSAEQQWATAGSAIPNATFAVAPRVEDLPVWAGSFEMFLPWRKLASLAGEAYVGQSVHRFEGALWQVPRVDPVTGRHRALRSAGGWAQVAVAPREPFEVRLVGGVDRILGGLDYGLAPDDANGIRENRLVAIAAVWRLMVNLSLGVQVHAIRTDYASPVRESREALGTALTSRLTF